MLDVGRFTVPWVVVLPFVLFNATSVNAFSTGIASTQFAGLGCNQCHVGGFPPTLTLTGPTAVLAGSTNEYLLQIEVADEQNKGGLNVAATAGTLATGGGAASQTRLITGKGGLAEITHMSPKSAVGGAISFTFLWTAPDAPTSVTLTAWGNAVNGNGLSTGDKADFETLDISVQTTSPTPIPCPSTPSTVCLQPTKSKASLFQLKDKALDSKDKLTWKWTKGEATLLGDFGDPLGSTSYSLCVYDERAGVANLVMTTTAPPGGVCAGKPCWKAIATGYRYKDKDLSHDGLLQILLKAGASGRAKIILKGKGENLLMPTPVAGGLLAQDQRVTVQLHNSDGACWTATYSAGAIKNDPSQFKDKSD